MRNSVRNEAQIAQTKLRHGQVCNSVAAVDNLTGLRQSASVTDYSPASEESSIPERRILVRPDDRNGRKLVLVSTESE
jgi:hypothetical protein